MADRTPLIAANWKMHKTSAEAAEFIDELVPAIEGITGVQTVICPPATLLRELAEALSERGGAGTGDVGVGAQNMHFKPDGAFTGELSASMLLDAGASWVILGHSERRQHFNETDEDLGLKVPAAIAAGLSPILCVGENETERESGDTLEVLDRQIKADLEALPAGGMGGLVIAYEPIWAIGTGRTATTEQAQEACQAIRGMLGSIDAEGAEGARILYGGSVNPGNAAELMAQPDLDGALVGGASLEASDFAAIVRASV